MQNHDVRWKQRFDNLSKALKHLEDALEIINPDIIQKAGIIQFLEMSFELSWNMFKDYLEDQGFVEIKSPRAALKKAFEMGLIGNGHKWMHDLVLQEIDELHDFCKECKTPKKK